MKKKFLLPFFVFMFFYSTAQKKWVDVNDFGVIANDEKIDNYNQLLSAFSYAQKNNIRTIKIPAGTFYISKGFMLNDDVTVSGTGMDKTVLKLINNLPPRTDEATQTAVFTGIKSFSLSQSSTTKNIIIKSLTIILRKPTDEFRIEKFSMLGGIRLINPVNCLIDSVKIINPPKFGIGLYATSGGVACTNNRIQNCFVIMQDDWYLQIKPEIIPRSNETCIGIEIASPTGKKNNGAGIYIERNNADYILSKARKNIVKNTCISGGSHGISISNACNNTLMNNTIKGCSHRGIIIITCSDSNIVSKNKISDIGSTAIHMAYSSSFNIIKNNIINGILGVEGDGIKSYINCNNNQITDNIITNFAKTGIRVSHGANGNMIERNTIVGNNLKEQIGIKIIANNLRQYQEGFEYDNKLTANNNTCLNNDISSVALGVLINDEMNIPNSLKRNKTEKNKFRNVNKQYNNTSD